RDSTHGNFYRIRARRELLFAEKPPDPRVTFSRRRRAPVRRRFRCGRTDRGCDHSGTPKSVLSPSRCCYAILCRPRSCGGGPPGKRRAIGRSSNPARERLPRLRGCVLARRLEREGLTCNVVLQEGRELAPRHGGAAVARRLVELRAAFEQGAAPRNVGLQI